jgi:AcrR family transcriptional regulator
VSGNHDARERLVAAAEALLLRSGPRAVSMDAAAAAAGAGKMSAYRHFDGKEDLLAAALERRRPEHLRWLIGAAGPAYADPAAGILSPFDRLESAADGRWFRGCPYVDAALATPSGGKAEPGAVAWRHKEDVMRTLTGMARQAGLACPEELGAAVALLIDGCAAQAALAPDRARRRQIIRSGRRAAEVLLAEAGRP